MPRAVAFYLGVKVAYVYAHAAKLGARRLGDGPRARLHFDLAKVDRAVASCSEGRESGKGATHAAKPDRRRARAARAGTSARVLPVRGPTGRS